MARRRRYNHKRRRGSLSFLYKLLAFVLICTAISLALTLFFRIRSIEVSGNDRYTRQEIIDAAGVNEGDNMFLMNKYSAAERIRRALFNSGMLFIIYGIELIEGNTVWNVRKNLASKQFMFIWGIRKPLIIRKELMKLFIYPLYNFSLLFLLELFVRLVIVHLLCSQR